MLLLGLESVLSHGESGLSLLLTQRLLGSLEFKARCLPNLRLGKSTAHRTGLLHAEISRDILSMSILLLQLQVSATDKPYSSSLLHVHDSQGAGNVLAHGLDLSKLRGSSSSNLGNTKLGS